MNDKKWIKRLEQEMPRWDGQGWITKQNQMLILQDARSRQNEGHSMALIFGILGTLLLGAGVILFFAANWQAMAKLTKLIVLFGGLWGSYSLATYFSKRDSAAIGQALLLLGVILFGANVMLIAQIYHIDSHYPDGILLWCLGGILTAWLLHSQPALIAGTLLAMLWTGMETFEFYKGLHVPFLIVWTGITVLAAQRQWRVALHFSGIALLFWALLGAARFEQAYTFQVILLSSAAAALLTLLPQWREQMTAEILRRYLVIGSLFSFFLLTFPDLLDNVNVHHSGWRSAILAAFVLLLAVAQINRKALVELLQQPWEGMALAAGLALLGGTMAVNVYLTYRVISERIMALPFNLLFFALLVWMVYAALKQQNRFYLNLAFVFFALGLISRYFDTFWSLMGRSFFFMGGGVMLLIGGYLLEKQRRKLNHLIEQGGQP